MTNSLNTPAEAIEYAYPMRVVQYRASVLRVAVAASFKVATELVRESNC